MINVTMLALALCAGICLIGCASIDKRKDADPETETSGKVEQQRTAGNETSGSSPEVQQTPAAYTGGSGDRAIVSGTGTNTGEAIFPRVAASLFETLDRIVPGTLSELNWNRIATVVVGLLFIAMIYGLAFALGRLPARRRAAASRRAAAGRGGTPRTAAQAGA
jgi:hypothetical protein